MDFWYDRADRADIDEIFNNSTYGITNSDLRSYDLTWNELREAFDDGWISGQSQDARDRFFDYLADLGYDTTDFDWDAWREWYSDQ